MNYIQIMNELNWKIMYLLRWMYDMSDDEEQRILSIADKMTDEEKKNIIYALYKKFEIENNLLKQAILKLKIVDHDIEEYHTKQEADIWLEKILSQIKETNL